MFATFNDLLGSLGGTNPEIACQVSTPRDPVDHERVKKWRQKDHVPSVHWRALLTAARRKGYHLTADDLLDMQERARRAAARTR